MMMASILAFSRRSVLLLLMLATASQALNVGDLLGTAPSGSHGCSQTCESSFCIVPPLLRYGKYCGILYSGCPGEKPCDALDACCMVHDHCVATHNNGDLVKLHIYDPSLGMAEQLLAQIDDPQHDH